MNKKYITPKMVVIDLDPQDIVCTSPTEIIIDGDGGDNFDAKQRSTIWDD